MSNMSSIRTLLQRIRSKTARLAFSYLAVIMALSIGFSTALYFISANELNKQLQPPASTKVHIPVPGQQSAIFFNVHPAQHASDAVLSYLRQRVTQSKRELIYKLSLLNAAMLVIGSGLSYVLARRTLKPIEAAMRAQSQFASNASHELRTPLAAMRLEIEDGLRTLQLSPGAKRLLESNLEELSQLTQISEAMLSLARQTEELKLAPVWIDEVASKAMGRIVKSAQAKRMHIIDTTPHAAVLAHHQSLMEALVILLENAVKYSLAGGRIYIETSQDKKYGYMSVRDEGPGIAPEDKNHIFDRFYRGKTNTAGHGLGLSIAQTLITKQDGVLTAANGAGKGAVFTIKLPLYRSN